MSEDPYRGTEGALSKGHVLKNLVNIGIFVVQVLLLVLLGPWLIRFFLPVVTGWLIARLAGPLARFLEKHLHIVRKHSSFGIIFGAIALIVLSCYYVFVWIGREAGELISRLPVYYDALIRGIEKIGRNLQGIGGHVPSDMRVRIAELTDYLVSNLGQIISGLGGGTMEAAGNVAGKIPSFLISFIFVVLFAYFFIAQEERVHQIMMRLIPESTRSQLHMVCDKMKCGVGGYFRAQFKIMFVIFLILAAGLMLLGIDYGVLLAALIALLDFLPMLGTGTALVPWAVFFALSGELPRAAGLLILYGVTLLTHQLIQPKMVGDSVGLDALTTLVFLFIGYRVHGLIGMIVAIPAGMILLQLYEAGAFDHVLKNVKELTGTIRDWRYKE